VTDRASMEERLRAELSRMRTEIHAERPAPKALTARARRAMATALAGATLVVAVAVVGSTFAWRALGPAAPGAIGPAGEGPVAPSTSPPVGEPSVPTPLLSRPLALPSVPAGASCPTTPLTRITPGPGTGFSGSTLAQVADGVYLSLAGRDGAVSLEPGPAPRDGWYTMKNIWIIDGSYEGPLLIRGGRVDGEDPLQLAWNPTTPMQQALQIDPSSPSLQTNPTTGWRSVPMAAYVRSPGCYAYQLDGIGFTRFIVFEVSA